MSKHILIIGGGFAGLNAAKALGGNPEIEVTLVDRENHHLFQPLLYQVAMAGLSPAEIAAPLRSLLARDKNVRVVQGEAQLVDPDRRLARFNFGELSYDYLIMACGATHSYFGNSQWEQHAPGLKTIPQATEIRRRVLSAFELAESSESADERKKQLTFVIVGGGPTGVELAGAIGEMSRFTLARDFRRINPSQTRVILIEAGPRILPMFSEAQATRAARDLEELGVQVWTSSKVIDIDNEGVTLNGEQVRAATVLWAAGTEASPLGEASGLPRDDRGRVVVEPDLSLPGHPNVFVAGDQANFSHQTGQPLPGTAPVALQQGRYIAKTIRNDLKGRPRGKFHFVDKGQMATIGRNRAIVEIGRRHLSGRLAWLAWLVVHIYYLTSFKNRLFVVLQWAWSYLTFHRGARLVLDKEWRLHRSPRSSAADKETHQEPE